MKRSAWIATTLFAGIAIGLAAVPRLAGSLDARAQIEASLTGLVGAPVSLDGQGRFAFSPWPSIVYDEPRFSTTGAAGERVALIEAERLSIGPDFSAFIAGGSIGHSISLDGATVSLSDPLLAGLLTLDRTAIDRLVPSTLTLTRSTVRFSMPDRRPETITVDDAVVAWSHGSSPLRIDAEASWRGVPVRLASRIAGPTALVAGRAADTRVSVSLGDNSVGFQGRLVLLEGAQWVGAVHARLNEPQVLADLFHLPNSLVPNAVSLDADIQAQRDSFMLANASVNVGSIPFDGAFSMRFDGKRPSMQGTIAGRTLDLDALGVTSVFDRSMSTRAMPDWASTWRYRPIDNAMLSLVDLDLRVSAQTVTAAGMQFRDAGGNVLLRDGRLRLDLGEATLGGGRLTAAVDVRAIGDDVARLRARVGLIDGQLQSLPALPVPDFVHSARARIEFEAESSGRSIAELARGLTGRGLVSLSNLKMNAMPGFVDMMKPVTAQAQGAGRIVPTDFVNADVRINLSGPSVRVDMVTAKAPSVDVKLTGQTELPNGSMSMRGAVVVTERAAGWSGEVVAVELPISFQGSLRAPLVSSGAPVVRPRDGRESGGPIAP